LADLDKKEIKKSESSNSKDIALSNQY